jgi:hypothetical protein
VRLGVLSAAIHAKCNVAVRLLAVVAAVASCVATSAGLNFDVRINVADQRELHREITLVDAGAQRLQVDADRILELKPWSGFGGGPWFEAVVIPLTSGDEPWQSVMQRPASSGAEPTALAFSFCASRIIAVAGTRPGRCADLPVMAVPDHSVGRCGGAYCTGPYEGMPVKITAHERIAPPSEPGEPLTITGTVLDAQGRPRSGVIVYGYQTDRDGVYPEVVPPRSYVSNYQGRLRGWARSDARGRYRFDTIRPGSYGGNPAHIHLHVIEPGCSTYSIDDLMFAGDPLLERFTPQQRAGATPGRGGSGVSPLVRKAGVWTAMRDVHLGERIEGYVACP